MVNFTKSETPPACLAIEKAKPSSKNYRCPGAVNQVADDFKDKCYLCEDKNIKDINVEHFIAAKGDRDKMFDWKNLFFACSYCNNIKSDDEKTSLVIQLLDCTDATIRALDRIKLSVDVSKLPEKHFIVIPNFDDEATLNTASLLHKIYNEKTKPTGLKERGALNLRKKIIENVSDFDDLIQEYRQNIISKELIKNKIIKQLQIDSAFTAFKVWLVKDTPELNQEFSQFLPQ
jgi:hypothetical protein